MNWALGHLPSRLAQCLERALLLGRAPCWGRIAGASMLLLGSQAACTSVEEPPITLQVGPDRILHFSPQSAYAQYFELPGEGDVLRIILASYPVPCKSYVPPGKGDVYVTVTVHSEAGQSMVGREFAWEGLPVAFFSASHPAAGAAPSGSTEALSPNWALPYVRLAQEGRPLPPGGQVKITKFSREPFGVVEGEFKFSDAGDGEAATAALLGSFRVQLCHVEFDSTRVIPLNEDEKPKRR